MVPFELQAAEHQLPAYVSGLSIPFSLATSFSQSSPEAIASLKWALSQGRPVDIDLRGALSESAFESLEDLLTKAVADLPSVPPIILCAAVSSLPFGH